MFIYVYLETSDKVDDLFDFNNHRIESRFSPVSHSYDNSREIGWNRSGIEKTISDWVDIKDIYIYLRETSEFDRCYIWR